MSIKFICTCGKHLKAREEMAARRSVCPRCGSPVGIPSLKPTHKGTVAAPMTPAERLRHARENKLSPSPPSDKSPSATDPLLLSDSPAANHGNDVAQVNRTRRDHPVLASVPRQGDPRFVRLLSRRGVRRPELTGRHLERHWQQCLVYPLRAWRLCFGLALFLTVLTVAAAVFLPDVLAEAPSDLVLLTGVLVLLLIVSIPCSFLDCVLVSAATGEVYYILWWGSPLVQVPLSGTKWLLCFLAGPVVFAAAGWLYWQRCGDPGFVDWLILTELGVVGIASWLFALVSLNDRGRLRDLNPVTVADLAHRLGWWALVVVLGAALFLLAHGWLLLTGVVAIHTTWLWGLLLLTASWLSGMYWSTFFCRLLGVWSLQSRQVVETKSELDG